MKLTSVEIHPSNSSDVAVLSFRDPTANNPYNIKSIVGLDAEAITPKHYKGSGISFYNMSLEDRDVVFKIGLNPRFGEYQSYSDLRDNLYKMISSSRTGKVQIQFKNGAEVVAEIFGFVSRLESPLFEKTQEIQITFNCDQPVLRSPTASVVREDLVGAESDILTINDTVSTAPHGFYFDVKFLAHQGLFRIGDEEGTWFFEVDPSGGFEIDDVFIFSSEQNNKSVYLKRGFIYTPIADKIYPGSVWPILFPGLNRFQINTDLIQWNQVWHYPAYWGV